MNYEFNPSLIQSDSFKRILHQIEDLKKLANRDISIFIVGAQGVGKTVLAQFICKEFYKKIDIEIKENIKSFSEIKQHETVIYTLDNTQYKTMSSEVHNYINQRGGQVIMLPSLRERRADLVPMAHFILEVLGLIHGQSNLKLSEKSIEMILQQNWLGEIYEFEETIENAFHKAIQLKSKDFIEPQHLTLKKNSSDNDFNIGHKLEEIERKYILQTLYFVQQNRTKAAEILGISIRTLRNKINQYREEGFL